MSEDKQGKLCPADIDSVSYGIRSQCKPVENVHINLCIYFISTTLNLY